jgi:asparagine synthase (glutamine-hydrolysing)
MCGIAGFILKETKNGYENFLEAAVQQLSKRGPDAQNLLVKNNVGLGHARLSIIDTSTSANQPFSDPSGRYTIVFNGEIFNYRELRNSYLNDVTFQTHSDTEVLLHLFIKKGVECINLLNGFFAFVVYDSVEENVWIVRDRFGIKPMLIYEDDTQLLFASEMKALLQFPIKREIDFDTLSLYLQLNYIPLGNSMLKGFRKLLPGYWMKLSSNSKTVVEQAYYHVKGSDENSQNISYENAQSQLRDLVEASVQRRLVSDVPLGAFLSGGIDSSIVVSQAAKHTKHLNTFSIGFKDEPYFDETKYANLVAKKFNTNHTVFNIATSEMFENLNSILDYIDEPFADSSAIAVYILSNYTRKHVTVALSGDGGDELFAGYNKHKAELQARKNNLVNVLLRNSKAVLDVLPASRHSKFTNIFRQLQRYSAGLQLSNAERYWRWCAFVDNDEALKLLNKQHSLSDKATEVSKELFAVIDSRTSMNTMLLADTKMVLPNDMLTKVDLMSMANSLEVRVPLLDFTVVDFAFSLPFNFKLKNGVGKSVLKDAFRNELPQELFTRPKSGFEVPLLKWFRTALKDKIEYDYLNDDFVAAQGIFDLQEVKKLKAQLNSSNPGDVHARIWGLIVFQHWYKKYFV